LEPEDCVNYKSYKFLLVQLISFFAKWRIIKLQTHTEPTKYSLEDFATTKYSLSTSVGAQTEPVFEGEAEYPKEDRDLNQDIEKYLQSGEQTELQTRHMEEEEVREERNEQGDEIEEDNVPVEKLKKEFELFFKTSPQRFNHPAPPIPPGDRSPSKRTFNNEAEEEPMLDEEVDEIADKLADSIVSNSPLPNMEKINRHLGLIPETEDLQDPSSRSLQTLALQIHKEFQQANNDSKAELKPEQEEEPKKKTKRSSSFYRHVDCFMEKQRNGKSV
jgi:hypothetical protein